MPNAILFDLDGTLVDTLPDVTEIMNFVLAGLGFPPRTSEEMRTFMGWGSREMSRLSLPEKARTERNIAMTDERITARYAEAPVVLSRPYAGIPPLLRKLNAKGVPLAVLSNKPDELTKAVIRTVYPDIRFARVQGAREGTPHKPNPAAALAIAQELDMAPDRCFFVGDSDVDMKTAVNAGMIPTAVTWGYRNVEELIAAGAARILDTPDALLGFLE